MNTKTICMMLVTENGIEQSGANDKWSTRRPAESELHFIARALRTAPSRGLHPIERRLIIQNQHQTWFCVPLLYTAGNYGVVVKPKQPFIGCPLPPNLVWDQAQVLVIGETRKLLL